MLINPGRLMGGSPRPSAGVQYATWTDLTNLVAENNGVRKNAGGSSWNSAGRTVKTGSGNGTGIRTEWSVLGGTRFVYFGICDSGQATGSSYVNADQFSVRLVESSGLLFYTAYYGTAVRTDQTLIAGYGSDVNVRMMAVGDAIELQFSDDGQSWDTIYTWSETPHSEFYGRVAIYNQEDSCAPVILAGDSWS